jgi:predicted oxidoreductase
VNLTDPETALWEEAKKGNAEEDYQAYLRQYPKGKFIALAKTKLKRLKDEARAAAVQQDQQAWNTAQQGSSPESYAAYLSL